MLLININHSFNSKRCDYELPKGAGASTRFPCFNSKRCDYERATIEIYVSALFVSIPKGAIMSIRLGQSRCNLFVSIPKGAIMSHRLVCAICAIVVSIPKGAIMSISEWTLKGDGNKFQFQKVRLWVLLLPTYRACHHVSIPKGAIMSINIFSEVPESECFNSKRCDYEATTDLAKCFNQASFNSKRCDYESVPSKSK